MRKSPPARRPRASAGVLAAALLALVSPALASSALAAPGIEAHDVTLRLLPGEGRIDAEDRMLVRRDGGGRLRFDLNRGLTIRGAIVDGREVAPEPARPDDAPDGADAVRAWELAVPAGTSERVTVTLSYAGHAGRIGTDLTTLGPDSAWLPTNGEPSLVTIRVWPVPGTTVVAQGAKSEPGAGADPDAPTIWKSAFPTMGATLLAGPWTVTRRQVGGVEVCVHDVGGKPSEGARFDPLLRRVGAELARLGDLVSRAPCDRLDLVLDASFGTDGAVVGRASGGPEVMLLPRDLAERLALGDDARRADAAGGPRVEDDDARLRRLLARGWWGRTVMPSPASEAWCDALVTACADELADRDDPSTSAARSAERRRRAILSLSIDSDARRAGTDRAVMFLHALRRDIGDAAFWATLRRVATERRGTRIGWGEWRAEFEASAKRRLTDQFAQGLERKGAPRLELSETKIRADGGRFLVTGVLRQRLGVGEAPWRLAVPIAVEHLEGRDETLIDLASAEVAFSLAAPSLPLRVTVDPDHHVPRGLAPEEVPACLAATMARPTVVVVTDPDGVNALASRLARRGLRVIAAADAPATFDRGTSYLIDDRHPARESSARIRALLAQLPRRADKTVNAATAAPSEIVASFRSPADPNEFVTVLGPEAGSHPAVGSPFDFELDGRVTYDGRVLTRVAAPAASRASRLLLPETKSATSPERVRRVVAALAAADPPTRVAGSPAEAKARRVVLDEMRLAGVEPEERPFSFTVKDVDPSKPVLVAVGAGTPVAGVTPFVASAETPEGGIAVIGSVEGDDDDLAGRALVVDLGAGTARPLDFLRDVAKVAVARKASALFVRVPATAPRRVADLTRFVSAPGTDPGSPDGDAMRLAAVAAAATGSDRELPLPVVAVPADFRAAKDAILRLDVRFTRHEVTSANVVGRIRARGLRRAGTVVLGAHLDQVGAGPRNADDGATGAAAVIEAVNVLAAADELLARDVLVVFFGASEWGSRGSRAFAASLPAPHGLVAMVGAERVGDRDVGDVSVVGGRSDDRLTRCVVTAIEQSALDVAPAVPAESPGDSGASARVADATTFALAGVPAVSLWSAQAMSAGNRPPAAASEAEADAPKIARVGRALALTALAAAGGW